MAKKVGVSEATVSRVLNGKPGVSEATRQAVLTALDVLGYERPTKLRGERARLVGLVLPELQNPIFPAFAEVVGGALAQQGFTPVLCTQTAGGVTEADYVDLLLQQQVSGVVFAGGLYAQARRAARPLRAARRPQAAGRARQRRRSTGSASRASRATTPWPPSRPSGHLALARPHADRAAARAVPTTCPSQRKLAAAHGRRGARRACDSRPDRVAHVAVLARGGQAAATRLLRAGRDRHRLRQRPDGARRDPGRPAGRACACPATSRSSASTTRR